ncbi:ATP-binding protein [Treponema pedis]|uniref:Putative DNA binding domain-containing protein n=1 Tax=Treponema pedis TaxID=409322 RepID=A0A7S7AWL3_9SPIR|nr:RNA-binding domain-containing protein [Treponema pedis]QOW61027.1 putative DNA binding domain-containing protein [Treponema pedis]
MILEEEIERGESRTLEYKVELPADSLKWIKSVIAFANTSGGKLVLGINNKREFVGLSKETDIFKLKDSIADTIGQMCEPQVMFDVSPETVKNVQLLVLQIYPGNATPYYIKSVGKETGTYIRLGATTRNADSAILDELYYRGKHLFYDEFPNMELKITNDDIAYLCKDFSTRSQRKITQKDLENLHLLIGHDKRTGTNALAILLGKHNHNSRIQCARFKGTDRVHFLDKKEYEGPLCEQIDGAFNFVLAHINMELEINGIVHQEKYELPPAAIREMIVNAVTHRNYQMNSSVQVAVYDNRVEISSPGTLYGTLTLEEAMQGRSCLRNQTLARTLEKIGIIEGWGTGLRRIFALCDENKIEYPVFEELGTMMRISFYRPFLKKIGDKSAINKQIGDKSAINKQIGDKSAINVEAKILEYLKAHPNAKSQDIAGHIRLKISRTRDYLAQLVEAGKVQPSGGNKNRTYSLQQDGTI